MKIKVWMGMMVAAVLVGGVLVLGGATQGATSVKVAAADPFDPMMDYIPQPPVVTQVLTAVADPFDPMSVPTTPVVG